MTRRAPRVKTDERCENCEHYMSGFYKATQTIPGQVCGAKPKAVKYMRDIFPMRKYFYKAYPDGHCVNFKKWKQPTKEEIYGCNKRDDNRDCGNR